MPCGDGRRRTSATLYRTARCGSRPTRSPRTIPRNRNAHACRASVSEGVASVCAELLLHQLHVERDPDVVADHEPARFQHLIPRQPEFAALQGAARAEAGAFAAPGIAAAPFGGHVEG